MPRLARPPVENENCARLSRYPPNGRNMRSIVMHERIHSPVLIDVLAPTSAKGLLAQNASQGFLPLSLSEMSYQPACLHG